MPKSSLMSTKSIGNEGALQYYWHVHHKVLCEALTEPIQNRIDYIRSSKPKDEVETRLRCMTPVLHPERLPVEWREADAKFNEADAKFSEAYAKFSEAYAKWREADAKRMEAYAKWREADAKRREAYAKWREADAKWREAYAKWREADAKLKEAYAKWREADAKCLPRIKALHKEEHPDCPWDGTTIFPRSKVS